MTQMTEERLATLMVKVTDETAIPREREELMDHIANRPELLSQLDEHRALRAISEGWVRRLRLDLAEDRPAPAQRGALAVGAAGLLGGSLLIGGWGMAEAMQDPSAPLVVRVGLIAVAVGTLLLLGGAALWKVRTARDDDYTEVVR